MARDKSLDTNPQFLSAYLAPFDALGVLVHTIAAPTLLPMPLMLRLVIRLIAEARRFAPAHQGRELGDVHLRGIVDSSGTISSPNSTRAKRRIAFESYSMSSAWGSERPSLCCRKYTRSIVSSGSGRRPRPGLV